ncbi:MAG: SH3 domain-containing protein [Anaerolinea sp.]|nr:SH3 domain-containing protein [Anaerolinea sp.]
MTNKIVLRLIKTSPFLLLTLVIMACSSPVTEIPVEDAVAQTIAARDAVALQVEQTVAALAPPPTEVSVEAPTEAPVEMPAEGDVADPNANVPVSQPVVDPNLAGGTPQLRVTASSVNVRSGPGINYPPITTLRQDAVVVVAAKNQNGTWFLIELPGGARGWISNTVTTAVVEADMIKVVIAATIPAPPTAVPTNVPAATATATVRPTTAPVATTAATTAAATHTPTVTTAAPTHTPMATATATATTPPTPTETATHTPEPPPIISVVITVQNNSSSEICFLFIDLSSDPTWSVDRLGTTTILPGGQVSLGFPSGEYDFMALDCNSNLIADEYNVQVGGGYTWDVR